MISSRDVEADLDAGTATFEMSNVHMMDYITIAAALGAGGPKPVPGYVSFKVTWNTTGPATLTDLPAKPFFGEHAPALGQMEWSGRAGVYEFQSHPIETSSSPFGALLGRQRNGSMY